MSVESCREKIVNGALQMFLAEGIKNVTMDRIAASLSVSKRTIYEHFSGKEELVEDCLALFKRQYEEMTNKLKEESENSFVFLLSMIQRTIMLVRKINRNFFSDMETIFAKQQEQAKMDKVAMQKEFSDLLLQSQNDAFIQKDLSPEILSMMYYGMLTSLRDKSSYDFNKFSFPDVLQVFVLTFFRGVATEKGLKLIEKYDIKQ